MALAAVIYAAGDLRVEDVPVEAPGPGRVLVKIASGGICGSDLHYFNHGGFGTVRLREPMVLGHEVSGTIEALGPGVLTRHVGQRVALNPSLPCHVCDYCQRGLQNHCLDMRFYGSAMRFPHVQGAFCERLVCTIEQAVPIADALTLKEAAFAEPLAVCLHAVRRAGDLVGKRVLITGAGPIGVLTTLSARRAGAKEIVVLDIVDETLSIARRCGADAIINAATSPEGLLPFETAKGSFDVLFECSGNNQAFNRALAALRPRGIIVQVGLGGDFTLLINTLVAKEFDLRGTFRFHEEFDTAVAFLSAGLIDVRPLLTGTVRLADAAEGFRLAADRRQSMKVQIEFETDGPAGASPAHECDPAR
jgi:L-idonate 5-dehydrogenase